MISFDNAKSILKPFLFHPTKPKYIREIEKACDLSYERVHHYLIELERTGVVVSSKRGKIKEYSVNRKSEFALKLFSVLEMERRHKFYEKNRPAMVWFRELLDKLSDEHVLEVKSRADITFILLFGSVARLEARKESDIDILLIVKNNDREFGGYVDSLAKRLEAIYGRKFSIQVIEIDILRKLWKKEPVYHNIWTERIIIYGEESFWKEALGMGEPYGSVGKVL